MARLLNTLSAVVLLLVVLLSSAGAKSKRLEIGTAAPSWSNLIGVDGKEHSLPDAKEATAVVVVFTCNTCPVARAYEDRLKELAEAYKDKGVVLVAINANKGETIESMVVRAEEKKFPYTYLLDATQEVAKAFGATRTPEVFLLGKDRKIVYTGAIDDDGTLSGRAETHYLRDAIEATLAGKTPDHPQTEAFGCGIQWKK